MLSKSEITITVSVVSVLCYVCIVFDTVLQQSAYCCSASSFSESLWHFPLKFLQDMKIPYIILKTVLYQWHPAKQPSHMHSKSLVKRVSAVINPSFPLIPINSARISFYNPVYFDKVFMNDEPSFPSHPLPAHICFRIKSTLLWFKPRQ